MKYCYLVILIFSAVFLVSCATTKDVPMILTERGTYEVVGYSAARDGSINKARLAARKYCAKKDRAAVIVQEETVYQSIVPENANKIARKAGNVAGIFGAHKAADTLSSGSENTDYKTTLEFKCQCEE